MNAGSNSQRAPGELEKHCDVFLDHFGVDFPFLLTQPLVIQLTLL